MAPGDRRPDVNCEVEGCADEAAFELHVPWADNQLVCAAHARVKARQDGVVADALAAADEELPEGASNREQP